MANPVSACSATYRRAVNKVAKAIKVQPNHTRFPSEDFEDIVSEIPDAMKSNAIGWYERGIKRGLRIATDLMANGEIYMSNNVVYAPPLIPVKTKVRFADSGWEVFKLNIDIEDIGFN